MRMRPRFADGSFAFFFAFTCFAAFASTASARQNSPDDAPEVLSRLAACRAVTPLEARVACYEAAATALETAYRQGDVVVIDRNRAAAARREDFGLARPPAPAVAAQSSPERIDSVETSLTRAAQGGDGKWVFVLADGSTWRQIDSDRVSIRTEPGQAVRVRRAALGSYLLTVGRSGAVRVRRQ